MKKPKNSYLEDFEGMIIRNDYMSRSVFDPEAYDELKHICKIVAKDLAYTRKMFFDRVSYDLSDIEQLCNCYLMSYISLYSFKHNEEIKNKFIERYAKKNGTMPEENVLKNEERNRAIKFLRQQCTQAVTVVNRKSRNVIVGIDKAYYYAFTKYSIPVSDYTVLIESYKKLKYRKVSLKEYNMLKSTQKKQEDVVDEEGYEVICIKTFAEGHFTIEGRHVYNEDFEPESLLMNLDEERELEQHKKDFQKSNKRHVLRKFIKSNENNDFFKKEISTARKMLRKL